MGQMSPEPLRVAVVGGGISGLSAAYFLEQQSAPGAPVRCTLLEASHCLGGKVQTESTDGFLLEQGPDSLLARKPHALRLCAELGLSDDVVGSNPAVRGAFIFHRGRLEPLPESKVLVAPTRIKPFLTTRLMSVVIAGLAIAALGYPGLGLVSGAVAVVTVVLAQLMAGENRTGAPLDPGRP